MKPPCRYCEARCLGCHSTCEKYKEYDEERKEIRKERMKEIQLDESETFRIVNAERNRKSAYQRHMKKRDENAFALRMMQEENGGM